MLQRLIAAVLAVLGVAAIALGVASATAWRADDPLVATAAPGGSARTLVTDPGVLELAGDPVTVTVRAEGSPVVLAVGRDTDVDGWLGDDPYVRVTGLSDWHTLATATVEAPAPEPSGTATADADAEGAAASPSPSATGDAGEVAAAADPTGSDMWLVEVTGDGSATLEWPARDGRWSLLAVSLGDTAPVLDLAWPQTVTTPWLWPGVALGVLLLAVAAVLLVRILRARRQGPDAGWHAVATGQIAVVTASGTPAGGTAAAEAPPVDAGTAPVTGAVPLGVISATGAPLTRRQIREAEAAAAAAAAAARRRGRRGATGAIPVVTGALPTVTGATPTAGEPGDRPGAGAPGSATGAPPSASAPGAPPAVPSSAGRVPSADGSGGAVAPRTTPGPTPAAPGSAVRGAAGDGPTAGRPGAAPGTAPAPSGTTGTTGTTGSSGSSGSSGSPERAATGTARPGHPEHLGHPERPGVATPPGASTSGAATGRADAATPRPGGTGPDAPGSRPAPPAPTSAPAPAATPTDRPEPASAPAAAPTDDEPRAPGRERRGLGARLPWRRSRADASASSDAAQGTEATGTATTPSWSPVAEPSGGAPGTAPRGTPTAAAPVPSADDTASPAQRADAWRRMWGFPSEGGAPGEDRTADRDDDQPTEEGR